MQLHLLCMRESGGSRSSDVKTIKVGAEMYFGLENRSWVWQGLKETRRHAYCKKDGSLLEAVGLTRLGILVWKKNSI